MQKKHIHVLCNRRGQRDVPIYFKNIPLAEQFPSLTYQYWYTGHCFYPENVETNVRQRNSHNKDNKTSIPKSINNKVQKPFATKKLQ